MLKRNLLQVWEVFALMSTQEKKQVSRLLIVSVMNGLIQTLGVVSIMPFIALIAEPELAQTQPALVWLQSILNINNYATLLMVCGGLSVLAITVSNGFVILNYGLSLHFFNARGHQLSAKLLRHYLKQSPLNFYRHSTAELNKKIFSDIDRAVIGSQIATISIITDIVIFAVIFALLLYINPVATLLTVAALVITYMLVYRGLSNRVNRLGGEFDQLESDVFHSLKQALNLYKEIRLFGKESFFINQFERPTQRLYKNATQYHLLQFLPIQIIEVLVFSIILMLAMFLAINSIGTGQTITSIAIYAFAAYRIVPVLKSVFESTEEILYAGPVLDTLLSDLRAANQPQEVHRPTQLNFQQHITFKDVSFQYPQATHPVLNDLNLTIQKGEMLCLKGPSGIGKSTTLDLLLGFLTPLKGSIYIDGQQLTEKNVSNWQRNIGYVPQQIKILDDTIARNIALGIEDANIDLEQVRHCASLAGISGLIETSLKDQYQCKIGEGFHTLSGGEKQRIAIARALYHNPSLLVLDEASNELDEQTEISILTRLKELNTTVVFVSHKPSVAQFCDRIFDYAQLNLKQVG